MTLEFAIRLGYWFAVPLFLTIILESGIAFLLGMREGRFFLAMAGINAITNPALNFFLLILYNNGIKEVTTIVLFCEIAIVLIEWGMLCFAFPGRSKEMFCFSIAMNGCSYLLGGSLIQFVPSFKTIFG